MDHHDLASAPYLYCISLYFLLPLPWHQVKTEFEISLPGPRPPRRRIKWTSQISLIFEYYGDSIREYIIVPQELE